MRLTEEESRYGKQRTAIEPREAQTQKREAQTRAEHQQYRAQELRSRPGDVRIDRRVALRLPALPRRPPFTAHAGWDLLSARPRGFVRVRVASPRGAR